jgi:two-component system chemotaxis response regulator CheY
MLRRMMESLFSCEHLAEAVSGAHAWEMLGQGPVDLIISDWNMPGLKGIDLLRKVRNSEEHKATPFLIVSAEQSSENIMEAILCGVSNYLTKPFTPDMLKRKLETMIKKCM